MNSKKKSIIATTLCLVMGITMVGCGNSNDKKDKDDDKVGRYIETKNNLPDDKYMEYMIQLDDGKIVAVASDGSQNAYMMTSTDEGKTWNDKKLEIPEEEGKQRFFMSASVLKNGDALISYSLDSNSGGAVASNSETKYMMFDLEGNKKEDNLDPIIQATTKGGVKTGGSLFKEDNIGDLFFAVGNEVVQLDANTKLEKKRFENAGYIDNYVFTKDSLVIGSSEEITKYNIESGEKKELKDLTEKVKTEGGKLIGSLENKVYFANSKGLFTYDLEGEKIEKIVDGDLSQFGVNSKSIVGFHIKDSNEFIVGFGQDGSSIVKYSYSADSKAVPDNKVKIYSLFMDFGMKDLIAEFTSSHPDISVEYEYGMDGEGITVEDAIKKLNTEILGGNGPDIMILEGLPTDSYIKQGLLEDINSIVEKGTSAGELFEGVKNVSTKDGKIYSYPTLMQIPIVFGNKELLGSTKDIETFKKSIEDAASKGDRRIFENYLQPQELIFALYSSFGYDWLNDDNSINKEALEKFMTSAKDILTINNEKYDKYFDKMKDIWENPTEHPSQLNGKEEPSFINSESLTRTVYGFSMWDMENTPQIELGYITDTTSYYSIISAMLNDSDNIDYKIQSRNGKTMMIPFNEIGINANSGDKDLAKEFVSYMLSEDGQKAISRIPRGFSVNKKILNDMMELTPIPNYTPYFDETTKHHVVASKTLRDGTKLNEYWPNEEDVNRLVKEIESVETMPSYQLTVLTEVVEQFKSYCKGDIDLDKAIDNIVDNLEIYLAE